MSHAWRDLSPEALDRAYDARASFPGFEAVVAEYRRRTGAARAAAPWFEARYGPTPEERLDVYPATGPGPVLLFVHGGYWRALDKAHAGSMVPGFRAAGAHVVALDYTLAPEARLGRIVEECRRALAWVAAHARSFGADPGRVHVSGSSAGGHLAACLLAPGWRTPRGVPETAVSGATLLSGLFELEPLLGTPVNGWLGMDEAEARALSPALGPLPRGLPVVLCRGETEPEGFVAQTRDFAEALREAGNAVELVPPPRGSNHFDLLLEFGEPGRPLHEATRRAMGLAGS